MVSEKIALGDVGKGRARALVHMSLPSVRDAGYDRIVAFVTEGNKPSEKLGQFGFQNGSVIVGLEMAGWLN